MTIARKNPLPAAQPRIDALDVLRGIAVCGILLMNIFGMGGLDEYPLTTFPARPNAEWITWGLQTVFVQGAMRGLFTMLFGAGMLLMLRRAEGEDGRAAPIDVWARRALVLMALGTLQWAVLLWPGEILWNYGVSGLFLLAVRTANVRTLVIAAGLLIAGLSANTAYWTHQQVDQYHDGTAAIALRDAGSPLTAERRDAATALEAQRAAIHPRPATTVERLAQRTHFVSLLRWSAAYWARENIGITGWLDIAESLAFMMIGMALFRTGVLTGAAPPSTYRRMILIGYGGGLAWRAVPVLLAARTGWDMGNPAVATWQWTLALAMFEPARLLVTLGHAGLALALLQRGAFGRADTLRALGRMALTVYCLQSAIGSALFYGLGLVGRFSLPGLWTITVAMWIATALFCRWWLARFAMGPVERVLRVLAYAQWSEPRTWGRPVVAYSATSHPGRRSTDTC
ncbi:DUF418 domain-containing protein [Sphingomonas sp.]|uniref:DUF418 domain-containing protein n=1 Tax=Sphingomonas sp. TaxID=28214 RepID=UPI0035BC0698